MQLPDAEQLLANLTENSARLLGRIPRWWGSIRVEPGWPSVFTANWGSRFPLGTLDISFYRDDFGQIGLHAQVKPSDIPFEVEGAHIVLVDDVLYTGRTIRAAMNELFDYGRPATIQLATLIDRGGRELPIAPQYVGAVLGCRQIKC